MLDEQLLADLERDRVHDRLALVPLQARQHDVELGAVDHERHARHVRLRHRHLHEFLHGRHAVQHAVVHVDVDDVGAGFDLRRGDSELGKLRAATRVPGDRFAIERTQTTPTGLEPATPRFEV